MTIYRIIETGHRVILGIPIKSATRVERFVRGTWIYVDGLPDLESAQQFVRSLEAQP